MTPTEPSTPSPSSRGQPRRGKKKTSQSATTRWVDLGIAVLSWTVGGLFAVGITGATVLAIGMAMAYPKLPDISDLADYRPKLPMQVFASGGELLGEFGEERRNLTPYDNIPPVMVNAVLAIEDSRFFEHSGVDYRGIVRAALANVSDARSQGGSTITMQVARNFYLSNEKSYVRKIYEVLLTFKLERMLTKEQILEIYMNQIFLGHRAYGFAAASTIYFGKPLQQVTVAEAAMLAGLPKAPSAYNPITNPRRARQRQQYIIYRMQENGFITADQAKEARAETLRLRRHNPDQFVHADYLVEMVRQTVFDRYGEETYTRGLQVHTTVDAPQQRAAYLAVRHGVLRFERNQLYRGPERFIELPSNEQEQERLIDHAVATTPDSNGLMTAVVLSATPRKVVVTRGDGSTIDIVGTGLDPARAGLAANAPAHLRVRPGAVVRIAQDDTNKQWYITQMPVVEAAFVALDPRTGAIKALVGGFDFGRNKFNRALQSQRQPGSSFKPFIYSAAIEKGITGATLVNDQPLFFTAAETGGKPWEPRNYDQKFDGPMTIRTALSQSKNMVSIQTLQAVGTHSAQQWVTRFGFEASKHPPFLTLALGAGAVTPLEMAAGYGVFANGGYFTPPVLITKITDHRGRVLLEVPLQTPVESQRVVSPRNAFVMSQLLNEITRSGTAQRAQRALDRTDVYGKTGTTNDSVDAWFVGYHSTLSAAAWMGYDNPRNLGRQATGSALALPIWIDFMGTALKDRPVQELPTPPGVLFTAGEWFYDEFRPGFGVRSIGQMEPTLTAPETWMSE